ncbi:hypothetical protein BDV18DRAFT_155921 [Aspergillus unguis]
MPRPPRVRQTRWTLNEHARLYHLAFENRDLSISRFYLVFAHYFPRRTQRQVAAQYYDLANGRRKGFPGWRKPINRGRGRGRAGNAQGESAEPQVVSGGDVVMTAPQVSAGVQTMAGPGANAGAGGFAGFVFSEHMNV